MERLKVEAIFSTPVGHYRYDKNDALKAAVRRLLRKKKPGKNDDDYRLVHFYQQGGEHLLEENKDVPEIQDFKKFLEDCHHDFIRNVTQLITCGEVIITDCWVNCAQDGAQQSVHSHANTLYVGTHYLHVEEGAGDLVLLDPAQMPSKPYIHLSPTTPNVFNQNDHCVEPEEGLLVIWPGNLAHVTTPSTGRRTSISMNFMPASLSAGAYRYKVKLDDTFQ